MQDVEKSEETPDCDRCSGCGQIADDDEGTPWKHWLALPLQSAAAVQLGLVKPITCPKCNGTCKAYKDEG